MLDLVLAVMLTVFFAAALLMRMKLRVVTDAGSIPVWPVAEYARLNTTLAARCVSWLPDRITESGIGSGLLCAGLLTTLLMNELVSERLILNFCCGFGVVVLWLILSGEWQQRRLRRFEIRLLDTMELMLAGLQGGMSVREALVVASASGDTAVKGEFLEISQRLRLGSDVSTALDRIRTRYPCEGVRLLARAIETHVHAGSDFEALLRAIKQVLDARIKLRESVDGQLSGSRYAAVFAGALPYLLIPLFLWREPGWLQTLVEHPRGTEMFVAAAFSQVAGFIWLRRILRVEL